MNNVLLAIKLAVLTVVSTAGAGYIAMYVLEHSFNLVGS
jgi:hypothetical protein